MKHKAIDVKKAIAHYVTGKIIPAHDVFGHHYKFVQSGTVVDSVTTKLIAEKPHLAKWAGRLSAEYVIDRLDMYNNGLIPKDKLVMDASISHIQSRDSSGDIGTKVHNIIEQFLLHWIATGKPLKDITALIQAGTNTQVIAACRGAEQLLKQRNIEPIATELSVGSEKVGIAGTVDLILLEKGKLKVWDWKTSNSISDDYALQIGTYMCLFEEMTKLRAHGCAVAHLSKRNNKYTIYDIPRPRQAYAAAKKLYKVYDWYKNGRDKLIKKEKVLKI